MNQDAISYNFQNSSFQINYKILNYANQDSNQDAKNNFKFLFEQYKQIQDELHLKFPFSNYIKVAKIDKIESNQSCLSIYYYYDGLEGEKLEIPYIEQNSQIDEGFRLAFPLALNPQGLQGFDIANLKSVLFNLIEIFYWSANFGLFFDPLQENLYYYKEQEQFLLLPTFSLIIKYLFLSKENKTEQRFLDFRCKTYQNATYNFLYMFYQEFQNQIKDQDEDFKFFQENLIKKNNFNVEDLLNIKDQSKGVDYLQKDEKVQKKQPRYRFKQSMLLYQLSNNEKMLQLFQECSNSDSKIQKEQQENKSLENANKQQLDNYVGEILIKQFKIFTQFFNGLTNEFESQSFEIFGKFMQMMQKHLRSENVSENRIDWAPFTKVVNNKHKTNVQKSNEKQYEFLWSCQMNKNYRPIYTMNQQQQQNHYDELKIKYLFECNQNSINIKSIISEIQFSIDTADDLMFLSNMIAKEPTAINIYVDESRSLTLQTSISLVAPMEIFRIVIKIFDMLQIYYHMILDFYYQNIQIGRSIKEKKFQHLVKEIIHYVNDYEIDFDEQMKKIDEQNSKQKQQ